MRKEVEMAVCCWGREAARRGRHDRMCFDPKCRSPLSLSTEFTSHSLLTRQLMNTAEQNECNYAKYQYPSDGYAA